jgi:hypothetical protein
VSTATPTDVELPCPRCEYDLRGLGDGKCPECGRTFRTSELKPEVSGLVAEHWLSATKTHLAAALLPWRVVLSPVSGFRRECRLGRVLHTPVKRLLVWTVFWYVLLVVLATAVRFGLDQFHGVQATVGYLTRTTTGLRFGLVYLMPIHFALTWVGCVVLAVLGMVLSLRRLNARQFLRLTVWLLPFSLAGGVFAIAYEAVWGVWLAEALMQWFHESRGSMGVRNTHLILDGLVFHGPDLVLAVLGGVAVGTAFKCRRGPTPVVAAVLLFMLFPFFQVVQRAYVDAVHWPLANAVFGPPPQSPAATRLLLGPTFTPGDSAPVLAGTWRIDYTNGAETSEARIAIDQQGAVVFFEMPMDVADGLYRFVADGQTHALDPALLSGDVTSVTYRVLTTCLDDGTQLTLHIRIEHTTTVQRGTVTESYPSVIEETLTGRFDDEGVNIRGHSVLHQDRTDVQIDARGLRRDFVMRRIEPTTAPEDAEP